jgi:hypothetical protein
MQSPALLSPMVTVTEWHHLQKYYHHQAFCDAKARFHFFKSTSNNLNSISVWMVQIFHMLGIQANASTSAEPIKA